ncbi:hypothetical protein OD350_29000 (plasmid) [Clostridium beijerinckii]|uniref:nucleotide-binding protein n=1 Tax=Clostridium beijerinckii TaxID=1520 RepID=UPI00222658DD|nr:hypothetical protein [Clostridium beijerinckii]UYZ39113.1 hypothetical protein OD350_29000 [Clostridium beijerinckii]
MKVLFAIGQDTSNRVQNTVLEEFENKFSKGFDYKSEYYIEGVLKCLQEEEFNALVLNEELEKVSVDIDVIDKITDLYPDLQVIFAINDNHKESEYVNRLYALGVYDALYYSDFSVDTLAELLYNERTKKQAKDYYGIDEKIDDIEIRFQVTPINEEELTKTISSLEQSIHDGNLNEIFKLVDKEYNTKEMCYLLTMLPNSISEELIKSKDRVYAKYQKIVQKEIGKIETHKEKTKEVEPKIKYIERIKEVPKTKIEKVEVIKEVPVEKEKTVVIEKEIFKVSQVRYDSTIAVVSNAPTGKSFISWNLAHALSQNYKVALINIDDYSSACALCGIVESGEASLYDIENKSFKQIVQEGVAVSKNLTVYSGKFGERAELRRNTLMQLVSAIRAENNSIIIIDTATGYNSNLMSAANLANDILFVYTMNNVHIRMNELLLQRLNEEANSKNIIAILNNVYRSSKEYKNILTHLEKSNKFKDVVTLNNCGERTYDYMHSKTCNYLKENNEFTRDIDVLINALKLQGRQSNNVVKKNPFIKLLRRNK